MNFGHFAATDGAACSHWRQGASLTRGKGREQERQRGAAIGSLQKVDKNQHIGEFDLISSSAWRYSYMHFSQMVSVTTNTPQSLSQEPFILLFFYQHSLPSCLFLVFSLTGTLVNCKALFLPGKPETSLPAREPSGKESKP